MATKPNELAALVETVAALIGEIGSREKSTAAVDAILAHARQQSAEEIRQLKAQVEGLRKGAERYQYLRSSYRMAALHLQGPEAGVWCDCEDENGTLILLTEEDLDAAIDAAIAQEAGK